LNQVDRVPSGRFNQRSQYLKRPSESVPDRNAPSEIVLVTGYEAQASR